MMKLFTLIVLGCLLAGASFAQNQPPPAGFSPSNNYPNKTGWDGFPPCTLIDGASVNWSLTATFANAGCNPTNLIWNVGGANHILNPPTGTSTGYVSFVVTINHSIANDGATLGSGFFLPGTSNNQPFSTAAGAPDVLGCWTVSTTQAWCPGLALNMTPVTPPWSLIAATSCAGTGGANCTTGAVNMTTADLIVVAIVNGGANTISSPTDSVGTNTYTQALTDNVSGNYIRCFYVHAPNVSSSMTFSTNATGTNYPGLAVAGFKGSVASPLDQTNHAVVATGTTVQAGSVTPTQANELIVPCFGSNGGTNETIDSGYTIDATVNYSGSNGQGAAIAHLVQSAAAPTNPTWTTTGGSPNGLLAGTMTFK